MQCTVAETTKDEAEESHDREQRVSMVLARMLTAILAVTGLAVVAPVAHAVDNPTITLDAR